MAAFEYVALNRQGKKEKGVMEADSLRQARQQLKDKKLVPVSIEATVEKEQKKKGSFFAPAPTATASELALVSRQLATLLDAGLPLEEALGGVAKQAEKPMLRTMLLGVRAKLVEGHSFAESLGEYPKAFPDLFRATVAAGEKSGRLDLVMEQLADYTESSHETQKSIKGAMIYPIVLIAVSLLIVGGMLTFIVPKIAAIFTGSGQELPVLTQVMMAASDFLVDWWWALFIGIFIFIQWWKWMMKKEGFRYAVHKFMLNAPLLGKISKGVDSARVASTLSILSRSGVPLVEAMHIASQVTSNVLIRDAVEVGAVKLSEGVSLFKSLDDAKIFPPMMMQMIASGEASGELDSMMQRAATQQEKEFKGLVSTILNLFEPLMMVVMGGVVLVIVLAIMLPIISMNDMVE